MPLDSKFLEACDNPSTQEETNEENLMVEQFFDKFKSYIDKRLQGFGTSPSDV